MAGKPTRRSFHLLVGATLTIATAAIGTLLTQSLTGGQSLGSVLVWIVAGVIVTYFYLRWQARSQEESPEAIKERVTQLGLELRKQVQARSYGARRTLIADPLRQLDLDITPLLGWVRDPRLIEPEPFSEEIADDIVAAFETSRRRMLIVGEPGSGKTMAAYSLIEYLDEREGDERLPLLVNLSAWEAQDNFEIFLVDYLCSSVGYEVRERAVARAFIASSRYSLILDGLDEIPVRLRAHFSERLDEFVRGLLGEVGVVVTCRTQEYEELLADHSTALGLVQAVEIRSLTSEQLDSAIAELAKRDEDWEEFLSQRHHTAYQRVRELLSNPLFLNLAVVGHLNPGELLDFTTTAHELQELVLDRYLDRTLADQKEYEAEDARRYLTWIARFLSGVEVSPFGLKTSDYSVFDLADLTPPEPPGRYWLFGGLLWCVVFGPVFVLLVPALVVLITPRYVPLILGLLIGLLLGVLFGLVRMLLGWWTYKRSALSSRLTFAWPSNRQQRLDLLRKTGQGLGYGLVVGMSVALFVSLVSGLIFVVTPLGVVYGLVRGIPFGLGVGVISGLGYMLLSGLIKTRSELITSRAPAEATSRSLLTAQVYGLGNVVLFGLLGIVLGYGLGIVQVRAMAAGGTADSLVFGLGVGLGFGSVFGQIRGMDNGGWFVLLQKAAHRRLARAGKLPSRPYDFLEWGIEAQIFRRVGGGVRFRHNLIQQHLANP